MTIPIILMIVSYLLGTYFAYQEQRSILDKPLVYANKRFLFILIILFGWIPTFISLYLAYLYSGMYFAVMLFLARFLFMPAFNGTIKTFMDRYGI